MKFKNLNKEQGKKEISKNDEYIDHLTPFYRNLFLKGNLPNDNNSFKKLLSSSVIDPTENQIEIVNDSFLKIKKSLNELKINIDTNMNFIYTDGSDNIGMPYTKGTSMIMPEGYHYPESGVLSYFNVHLIAHELWHILSRNDEKLRNSAYQSIGFKKNDKKLHELDNYHESFDGKSLNDIYFINPDAINHDHYFEVNENGKKLKMFPLMVGNLNPAAIWVDNNKIVSIENLYSNRNKEYLDTMSNFSYNTHPEELCAEHFRTLVMDKYENNIKYLPNQKMMKSFRKMIQNELKSKKTIKNTINK